MKDKIMSLHELNIYHMNMRMLEGRLGYEVPKHLLNNDDMSKEVMSLMEIETTARNIELATGIVTRPTGKKNVIVMICEGFYWLIGLAVIILMFVL